MATIRFEEVSRLRRIGEYAFVNCRLNSIRIPASVEEIDGSAFVGSLCLAIEVAAGRRNLTIQGDLLTTADGTKLVRYIGRNHDIIVPNTIEILGKSCFESCNHVEKVVFEDGSKLRQIGPSAFTGCEFLRSIAIPASVEIIGDFAFRECDGLEELFLNQDGVLVTMGKEAFADCRSLRSFYFPKSVREVDKNCFTRCVSLHLLIFGSGVGLKNIVGDVLLEALETIGFADISSLFEIEVNEEGVDLAFPGWVSVGDRGSTVVLIPANQTVS
jgi:hypothetical protein